MRFVTFRISTKTLREIVCFRVWIFHVFSKKSCLFLIINLIYWGVRSTAASREVYSVTYILVASSGSHVFPVVSVRPVTLIQPLTDITICEGDIAQLEVKFSQENVEGTWMKNEQPATASNRVHIVVDKQIHKLLIEDTNKDDTGMYSFVVPAQGISTAAKLLIQSKAPRMSVSSRTQSFQMKWY